MVRIGACVVRGAVFSTVVYIVVQTNIARIAFRGSTSIPQHMTLVGITWGLCFHNGSTLTVRSVCCIFCEAVVHHEA